MKKLVMLSLILIALFSINASAEGITPAKIAINFMPNLKTNLPFLVTGYDRVAVETDCSELTYNNDAQKDPEGRTTFSVTLVLPSRMNGPKECGVRVKEERLENNGVVSAQVELISSVLINAPYNGRYIDLKLDAHNANKGDPITFNITANNLGDKALKEAQAAIDMIKDGDIVTTTFTEKKTLEAQSSTEFTKELDTSQYPPGKYLAVARLPYDNKVAVDQRDIIIGTFDIEILSYPTEFKAGKLEAFNINIESLWGKEIGGVHATSSITNKYSEEVAAIKSSIATLAPWQQTTLESNLNTTSLKPGTYDIKIKLLYQGKATTKTDKILIKKQEWPKVPITQQVKAAIKNPYIISAAIVLVILADLYWLRRQRQRTPRHIFKK